MNETTSTLRRATSGMQSKLQRRHSGLTFPTHETPSRMRRASAVTLQHHQTLSLPRKMTLMIDAPHIWNILYNGRSNTSHHPTSPKTSLATKNNSLKSRRILPETAETQCAMQWRPAWSDTNPKIIQEENFSPHPPCNRSYFSRSPRAFCEGKTHHFALRLAIQISNVASPHKLTARPVQHHQILHLPRKINSHDWSSSQMKGSLFTLHGAIRATLLQTHRMLRLPWKKHSRLTLVTYETWNALTLRSATRDTIQHHQILRLSRKMTFMIDPPDIWNVRYNAQSNRGHHPTSPNSIASARKNDSHDWSSLTMRGATAVTFQATPKSHCGNDPTIDPGIKPSVHTCLTTEVTFSAHHAHFVLKNKRLRAPTTIPNFIKWSGTPTLPNTAFAMQIILMIHNW